MYCHTELIYRSDCDIEITGHEVIESNLYCFNCDAEVLVYKIGEKEKNETK
jgi:hypothetical protein